MASRSNWHRMAAGLAVVLMAGMLSSIVVAGPTALFWQADGPSLVDGGADVPGQISDIPQVQRPTSLAAAGRGGLRVDYTSQNPLSVLDKGVSVGGWESSALSVQLSVPLGSADRPSRWHLGFLRRDTSDTLSYSKGDDDFALRLKSDLTALAASYQLDSDWVIGALIGTASSDGSLEGTALREVLELPPGSGQWPSMQSDAYRCALAVSRRHGRLGYGLQYDLSLPDDSLRLVRGDLEYKAPLSGSSQGWEAYVDLRRGHETYFLTAASHREHREGSIFVGLVGRGDVQLTTTDRRVLLGWRRQGERAARQFVLDWRQSGFDTYDQGYAGLWPGWSADVYGFRSSGDITLLSARYGMRWDVAPRWSLLFGTSLHSAQASGMARLRQSQGIGQNPLTHFELNLTDGRLWMLGGTLGACYQSGKWRAMVTYTAGYAQINDAFSSIGDPSPGVPGGAAYGLQPRGFWSVYFERQF